MKKKFIIIIAVLAVALGVIAFKPTLSWFKEFGTDKSQLVDLSYFDISLVGGCDVRPAYTNTADPLNPVAYAAPGENMIYVESPPGVWAPGPLTMLNKSTITTNLRVHIEYSWWNGTSLQTVVYTPAQQADFMVDFDVLADWSYDAATLCWNYLPGGGNIPAVNAGTYPTGQQTVLINSMGYSDALLPNNDYEDETVTVTLKVEAKQAEYATWTQVSP